MNSSWKRKLKKKRRKALRARYVKAIKLAIAMSLHMVSHTRYDFNDILLVLRNNTRGEAPLVRGNLRQVEDFLQRYWELKAFL